MADRRAGLRGGRPAPAASARRTTCVPAVDDRLDRPPADGEAYRFEIGGGHWIFGGDRRRARADRRAGAVRTLRAPRRGATSAATRRSVPYPLQDHLDALGARRGRAGRADELGDAAARPTARDDGASGCAPTFGPTLCDASSARSTSATRRGCYERIAPQDAYKSPTHREPAARPRATPAAATTSLRLPGRRARRARPGDGRPRATCATAKRVVAHRCRPARRCGSPTALSAGYDALLSTLPLDVALALAGIDVRRRGRPAHVGAGAQHRRRDGARACPDDALAVRAALDEPASTASASTATSTATFLPGLGTRAGDADASTSSGRSRRRRPDAADGRRSPRRSWPSCQTRVHRRGRRGRPHVDRRRVHVVVARLALAPARHATRSRRRHPPGRPLRPLDFQGIADSMREGLGGGPPRAGRRDRATTGRAPATVVRRLAGRPTAPRSADGRSGRS